MAVKPELHTIEISQRPRRTWAQTLNAVVAAVVFVFGCVMINGSQIAFLLPLKVLPFACAERMYYEGIRYSKGAFGALLVLMSQWFAPTKLVVTFEREGQGRFTKEQIELLVERNATGRVVGLRLPQRAVMIANHQVYADWWYAWSLTYYMGTCADVFIVLKESLKWLPILGWGMRLFNFIFLKRSWASDRLHLSSSLSWLGRRAETQDSPLTFILYPEGTLVSKDTKPLSKKFADKIGIPDMMHSLLPRSTGLHYSLRSLAPRIPSLQLIDITVTYPGIPPFGYGQSWYTLRSIFMDRVPPPAVHMHIRCFDVTKDVPIGEVSSTNPDVLPERSGKESVQEVDIPEKERDTFELWLRDLWREKDKLISKYLETGSMVDDYKEEVEIPLRLKRTREVFDAFCFFMPAAVFWAWRRFR
ncbi:acyltransferase-domain-containing protein [Rhodofomes roseus]|uniref:Acyltransferase-domain-containing protein n=1 Tax=Rhodofomes roseus TaxID=34475 RepID=A0ABQ8KDI1_9APHY|nr:acyltransferase-domain-containing protein [Rhodofomes roseus]KAH9835707.1 acyltransferase-domain-containing protein [Rhodofomes roseus]